MGNENRICPVMAQGWISGFMAVEIQRGLFTMEEQKINLPKCLKENCALWIITSFSDSAGKHESGNCGLINFPQNDNIVQMW